MKTNGLSSAVVGQVSGVPDRRAVAGQANSAEQVGSGRTSGRLLDKRTMCQTVEQYAGQANSAGQSVCRTSSVAH